MAISLTLYYTAVGKKRKQKKPSGIVKRSPEGFYVFCPRILISNRRGRNNIFRFHRKGRFQRGFGSIHRRFKI